MFIGRNVSEERLISLTFWYPILLALDIKAPETQIVFYPHGNHIWDLADGKTPPGWAEFMEQCKVAARTIGYPLFLRTEQTSNKHDWKDTCYVENEEQLQPHMDMLINFSMMVDLPMQFFVFRKLIPTTPVTTAFNDMPIARERRLFVKDGEVVCHHPYWPKEAFNEQPVTDKQLDELQQISDEDTKTIEEIASGLSRLMPFGWSVDFLQATDGSWYLIDMALDHASYHWPGCDKTSTPTEGSETPETKS